MKKLLKSFLTTAGLLAGFLGILALAGWLYLVCPGLMLGLTAAGIFVLCWSVVHTEL